VQYALSVDCSTALQAFSAAPILTTLVTSVDREFNHSEFSTHQGHTAILQIIDANCLGGHLSMHRPVSLLTF
jgi:hypothetical protein